MSDVLGKKKEKLSTNSTTIIVAFHISEIIYSLTLCFCMITISGKHMTK